jgi:murein DD-endopeptidase MepM/ murein hydrolase activator NlpD
LFSSVLKHVLPVLVILAAVPLLVLFLLSQSPTVELDPSVTVVGIATPVKIHIADTHGIRRLEAVIEQGGQRYPAFEVTNPAHRLRFFKNEPAHDVAFTTGTKSVSGLKDGKATLTVEAVSNDLRGASTTVSREINIVTQPPRLAVDDKQHYINQGGSELVTYSVGGYATESGVKVDGYRFGSFPLPGGAERLSLFAFPWDVPVTTAPAVYATNLANEVTKPFWFRVFPKSFRKRDLVIDDAFLERVVPQIDPNGTGDLLARFLKINGDLRKQNNKTLADLRLKTEPRFLWSGPFLQLSNSKVESQFADVRTYIYKGKKIDQQVHLGFDLSKVKNTPIPASNDGKVVLAEMLGIYGNCVVIDHGYTLQSIYGHLSSIQVKPGDMVKKGQIIGLSGSTGLAGGDHLHFSMQIDGVQVNPVEWWDAHWIHDRILSKLPAR